MLVENRDDSHRIDSHSLEYVFSLLIFEKKNIPSAIPIHFKHFLTFVPTQLHVRSSLTMQPHFLTAVSLLLSRTCRVQHGAHLTLSISFIRSFCRRSSGQQDFAASPLPSPIFFEGHEHFIRSLSEAEVILLH